MNDSYPGTRLRAFRISDQLYEATREKAKVQGDTLSEIVRAAFEAYLTDAEPDGYTMATPEA